MLKAKNVDLPEIKIEKLFKKMKKYLFYKFVYLNQCIL